jgi:hypothetical protein
MLYIQFRQMLQQGRADLRFGPGGRGLDAWRLFLLPCTFISIADGANLLELRGKFSLNCQANTTILKQFQVSMLEKANETSLRRDCGLVT